MQHRHHESNAWLITHLNSLIDFNKNGEPMWEVKCKGKGDEAVVYSHAITSQDDASHYHEYLVKKGVKCNIEPMQGALGSFRIMVPVVDQHIKKTRFNAAHSDVSSSAALEKVLNMLNEATPITFGKWSVSATQAGERIINCITHELYGTSDPLKSSSPDDNDEPHLANIINHILEKGAFSEDSARSIRHYFLDNLYRESHSNYNIYTIIDLAYIEQIENIQSLSQEAARGR